MLGKLLKYDFKYSARMLPVVYLAVAVAYLFGLLAKALNIAPLRISMSLLLVVGGVAGIIITFLTVILRYFKGLFGAEGYLSQTLPVSKGCLIASKVITAYIWMIISAAVAVLAFLAMFHLNDVEQLNELFDYLKSGNFTPMVIYLLLAGCVQLLAFLGELYFAITLANTRLFLKNNIVFSVVFYFASNMLVGLIEIPVMLFVPLGIKMSAAGAVWTTESMFQSIGFNLSTMQAQPSGIDQAIGMGNIFVEAAAGIVFLLLARWLMEHKTSVK